MMTRIGFFSALMVVGAIAGSAEVAQAQCLRSSNAILNRSPANEDAFFVNSSPANANSNFKLELDLNNGLDFLETDVEEDEVLVEESAITSEPDASSAATETAAVTDAEIGPRSSSAADLETVDLQAQIDMSRADYLNSRASEINGCVD
ncbi:hypothetical protein [Halomicronema sp. CCY15110]|uniref:hypothetical protein n=1 Tax=Halomicronema sp. CCY15110 TaxID=2767773 RepID=UPI0019529224|nr:hypothetical protein [Halomicronema sp. CCY15110]